LPVSSTEGTEKQIFFFGGSKIPVIHGRGSGAGFLILQKLEYTHKILYDIIKLKTIVDTSTLISLAKINFLELIPKLRKELFLPDVVYEEAVIKGDEKGIADAIVIKSFISGQGIRVANAKSDSVRALRKRLNRVLARGDEAVLSVALQEEAEEIMADDDGLGKIAIALGFDVKASPDLLMEGLRGNTLNVQDFEAFMRGLVIENRLSSSIAELYIMEGRRNVEE
jgi:predicted nucleic acid-binding protein